MIGCLLYQIPHGWNEGGLRALDGVAPSITTSSWQHNNILISHRFEAEHERIHDHRSEILEGLRMNNDAVKIRKLTPTECYKLMGFDAEDCRKCSEDGISDSQLYKQAGNSIVVNVLEAIFDKLGETYEEFRSV